MRTNAASVRVHRRSLGTSPPGANAGATPSSNLAIGTLAPIASELDRMAPSFDLRGEDIRVIRTPAEFYETLKVWGLWGCSYTATCLVTVEIDINSR
jgi:hypothetical protein